MNSHFWHWAPSFVINRRTDKLFLNCVLTGDFPSLVAYFDRENEDDLAEILKILESSDVEDLSDDDEEYSSPGRVDTWKLNYLF